MGAEKWGWDHIQHCPMEIQKNELRLSKDCNIQNVISHSSKNISFNQIFPFWQLRVELNKTMTPVMIPKYITCRLKKNKKDIHTKNHKRFSVRLFRGYTRYVQCQPVLIFTARLSFSSEIETRHFRFILAPKCQLEKCSKNKSESPKLHSKQLTPSDRVRGCVVEVYSVVASSAKCGCLKVRTWYTCADLSKNSKVNS